MLAFEKISAEGKLLTDFREIQHVNTKLFETGGFGAFPMGRVGFCVWVNGVECWRE